MLVDAANVPMGKLCGRRYLLRHGEYRVGRGLEDRLLGRVVLLGCLLYTSDAADE